jgi:hypothetical protein
VENLKAIIKKFSRTGGGFVKANDIDVGNFMIELCF